MSPALNYKALLYATPTHLPSICPFTRPHVIISALSMHLPPVLWAWIRAPATHFLGARILTTLPLSIPPAAFSALPQHLPSPFSVIVLSSQYLFQRGPIWTHLISPQSGVPRRQINEGSRICLHYRGSCSRTCGERAILVNTRFLRNRNVCYKIKAISVMPRPRGMSYMFSK